VAVRGSSPLCSTIGVLSEPFIALNVRKRVFVISVKIPNRV